MSNYNPIMLRICEEYGREFCVSFNAAKSASMYCGKKLACCPDGLTFYIDGKEITVVKKYQHLGHIISAQLDDKDDILAKRNSFCGKINNVLCYFRSCDPLVKVKLLRHYCCDYYGSVIWNLSHNSIEDICVAWRKGMRRILSLPYNTHSRLISPVCDFLPVREELICRCASFIMKCLNTV